MGTNTKLHSINHSIQQRNLESRENRTGKNQQDHGQHHKKNTNGTTEYPQGSALHWNRVAGSRSNKTKKPSAHGAQINQRQQPTDEKAHNKQHHNIKVGWRNEKGKRKTWNRWKGHEGRKNNCKKQNNQQSKRLVLGQNRKGEQWKNPKSNTYWKDLQDGNPKKEPDTWTNSPGSRPALSSKPEQECCQWKTTTETNTGTIPAEQVASRWRPKSMSCT